jgi:RimJ/RimL family protein N-acetyltransferase
MDVTVREALGWRADQPTLSDGAFLLRPYRGQDAADVTAACQDDEIARWVPIPVPYRLEDGEGYVGAFATEQWSAGSGAVFAVTRVGEDRVLGSIGIVKVHEPDRFCEIGYWLAPWGRGQGAMTAAVRLLADWAIAEGGFNRVELIVDVDNAASRAVVDRAGAACEGILRKRILDRDGEPRDMAIFSFVSGTRRPMPT